MKSLILLLSALICCISCSKIDDLENRVSTIEKQIGELQSAYQNGKIIKEVTPYVGDDYTGWTISFSDGQSINIYNGNDGADAITPIFRINSEGYWEVSYDNGESFSLLTDKEGNGVTGKGEDGVSVRVVISEDGRYVFELYQGSNPEDVIESTLIPQHYNLTLFISS